MQKYGKYNCEHFIALYWGMTNMNALHRVEEYATLNKSSLGLLWKL